MLRVVLSSYRTFHNLNRANLLQAFPESILAQAIRKDPTCRRIKLTHPDVTPESLRFLEKFLAGKFPKKIPKSLVPMSRYLNMPILADFVVLSELRLMDMLRAKISKLSRVEGVAIAIILTLIACCLFLKRKAKIEITPPTDRKDNYVHPISSLAEDELI